MDDGETAVIGGLTVSQVTVSKSGIPLLVDLPVLGGDLEMLGSNVHGLHFD